MLFLNWFTNLNRWKKIRRIQKSIDTFNRVAENDLKDEIYWMNQAEWERKLVADIECTHIPVPDDNGATCEKCKKCVEDRYLFWSASIKQCEDYAKKCRDLRSNLLQEVALLEDLKTKEIEALQQNSLTGYLRLITLSQDKRD